MARSDIIVDGISVLPDGMNSGLDPILLRSSQTAFSTNATHRGGFIRNRPGFTRVTLTFDGAGTQGLFESAIWQGGAFFKSEYGRESLVCSIGGRLFDVVPDISGHTATVYDRTIAGDANASGNAIAWLWQAERWMIINDGNSLPIFYDGNTARRSRGASTTLGTTALNFNVPAVGADVSITLVANYTGPANETIYIGDKFYQVNSAATYQATMTNLSEAAGTAEADESTVVIPSGLLGQTTELQASGVFGGIQVLIVTIDSAPNPALVLGDIVTVRTSGTNYVSAPVTNIINPQRVMIGPVPVGTSAVTASPVYRGYFSVASVVAALDAAFVTGAIGTASTVDLTLPYTGALPVDVVINGGLFRITAVNNTLAPTNVISVKNINDTPAAVVVAGAILSTVPELPVGKMGVYGMGRVWMCLADGRSFIASDIVGGPSGSPALSNRDAVLRITENDFLDGGGVFVVPGNVGDIQSMTFTANLDTSLGQGPLQIGTPTTIFSCQAPVDRSTWQTLENPILTESLKGKGPLGQYGTLLVNSDTLFRATDGIGSLILARRDFTTWGNVPISREMQRVIDEDNIELLGNATATQFDNRVLMACLPRTGPLGVYHQGIIALNNDPVSSLRGKAPSIYDGLWTGLQAFQLISGKFSGDERAFAFVFNSFSNRIELYELSQSGESEFDEGGQPITWSFESAALANDVKGKGQFDLIELFDGEMYLSDIQGVVNVQSWYRPNYSECWIPWHDFTICGTPNLPRQQRRRLGLGQPSVDDCDPTTNRPYRIANNFQVRFQISGACRFRGAVIKAHPAEQSALAKAVCEPVCENDGDDAADCQECKEQGDCLMFDLVFYNLNANNSYSNLDIGIIVSCPDGSTRTVNIPAGTINFTLPFPPGFEGPYPPLVLGCAAGGNIVRTLPDNATQDQIDDIVEEMIAECAQATAEAEVDCNVAAATQFLNQEVYFTGLACPEGTPINYSGTLPAWITVDTVNSRLVGAAGVFTGNTQAAANLIAQNSIDNFGNVGLGTGDLACGTPWTPADANPAHWYDAEQIVGLNDGDVVDNWDDVGTGTNDLGGNADVTHPVYKTNIINSLPVVRWELAPNHSTSLAMQTAGATPGVNSSFLTCFNGQAEAHIFMVALDRSTGADRILMEAESNLIWVETSGFGGASGFYALLVRRSAAQATTRIASATAKVVGQFDIYHVEVDFAAALASMDRNGTEIITPSAFLDAGNCVQASATFVPSNTSPSQDCDIAEIVIDFNNLTTDTIQKYEGYFAHKYALTAQLPIGHPYKTSPPIA